MSANVNPLNTEQLPLTVKYRGRTYAVASVEDAAQKWAAFRMAEMISGGGGCSQIGNGLTVRDSAGKQVAKISYNGRIWRQP